MTDTLTAPESTMKQVLVWEHKHGRNIYDASTPESLEASARKILSTLIDWQYLSASTEEPYVSPNDRPLLEIAEETVSALPEPFKSQVETARKRYNESKKELQEANAEFEIANRLIAGEVIYHTARRRKKYSADDWTTIVEAAQTKWKNNPKIYDDRIETQITAWGLLQKRNGYEYEQFELESVQ